VTVIDSAAFEDEQTAETWLERCRGDEEERESTADEALMVVNRAVQAHRLAAGDPYVGEVSRRHVHAGRLGYGIGEEVADGNWRAAYTLPEPRSRTRRRQMLSPQEQLAALLGGRSDAHPSEDLALRARLDLDQGRVRLAALQLCAAFDAFDAESAGEDAAEGLSEQRREARELADAALRGDLDPARAGRVGELLDQLRRPLMRRRHRTSGDGQA
jgi:hypothetical protein